MSLLPECPVCFGLMTLSKQSTLSSACRCGYPEKVTWDNFPKAPDEQFTETLPDPLLKRRDAA